MKIYTMGNAGLVPPAIRLGLGCPAHHTHERVYVTADSKTEAADVAARCGFPIAATSSDLVEAEGNMADILAGTLLLEEDHVYVTRKCRGTDTPLLRICPDRGVTMLGLIFQVPLMKAENPDGSVAQLIQTPGHPRLRFYPLPKPGYLPQLDPVEQRLIEGFGYGDMWDRRYLDAALATTEEGTSWSSTPSASLTAPDADQANSKTSSASTSGSPTLTSPPATACSSPSNATTAASTTMTKTKTGTTTASDGGL